MEKSNAIETSHALRSSERATQFPVFPISFAHAKKHFQESTVHAN